jgi:antirestriction protein ArdC
MSATRLDTLHATLEAGVAALATSEAWSAWLTTAAAFRTYSFHNQLLILSQRPDATRVAGYRTWQALGRQVRKGETSIGILAPMTRKVTAKDGSEERRMVGFRAVSVFDVSQTDGDPLPVKPVPVLLEGDAPAGLWDAVAGVITGNGFALERGDCGTANGITYPDARVVRVSDALTDAQACKTLIHECAHMLMHADSDADHFHRGVLEVEAESVAFMVATACGLPSDAYSLPYIVGWSNGDPKAVAATAARVHATARRILTAVEAATGSADTGADADAA